LAFPLSIIYNKFIYFIFLLKAAGKLANTRTEAEEVALHSPNQRKEPEQLEPASLAQQKTVPVASAAGPRARRATGSSPLVGQCRRHSRRITAPTLGHGRGGSF